MATVDHAQPDADIRLDRWQYPLTDRDANALVALLRTEWTRSDFDWLEAMRGDYSDDLTITSTVACCGSKAIASATTLFCQHSPEVALLANVITHRDFRGRGIGRRAIESAVAVASAAGCTACLLGTESGRGNVYERIGFNWHRGVVMRRSLSKSVGDFENEYFEAGQDVVIRPASWGDLPGLTFFAIQPQEVLLLDYLRGLVSGQHRQLDRCTSIFPRIYDDVRTNGGVFLVLVEPVKSRIFGFGTGTLGAGVARRHSATIDLAVHENYADYAPILLDRLLRGCRERDVLRVNAYISDGDVTKINWFRNAEFSTVFRMESAFLGNGETEDVLFLERSADVLPVSSD